MGAASAEPAMDPAPAHKNYPDPTVVAVEAASEEAAETAEVEPAAQNQVVMVVGVAIVGRAQVAADSCYLVA